MPGSAEGDGEKLDVFRNVIKVSSWGHIQIHQILHKRRKIFLCWKSDTT